MIYFSLLAAKLVIAFIVTYVAVCMESLSHVIALLKIAVYVAGVIENMLGMLPFSNESNVAGKRHFIEIPLDVTVHPGNDFIAGSGGYDGCYNLISFYKFLGLDQNAGVGFERNQR